MNVQLVEKWNDKKNVFSIIRNNMLKEDCKHWKKKQTFYVFVYSSANPTFLELLGHNSVNFTRQAKNLLIMKNVKPRTVIYTTQGLGDRSKIHFIVICEECFESLCNEIYYNHWQINQINTSFFRSEFVLIIHIKLIMQIVLLSLVSLSHCNCTNLPLLTACRSDRES